MKVLYIQLIMLAALYINPSHISSIQLKKELINNDFNKVPKSSKKVEFRTLPSGNGKALLLLPFQHEFNENVSQIESHFKNAGYETEIYKNDKADLDKFRGSFLADFDIVYISTHGYPVVGLNKTDNKKFAPQIAVGITSKAIDRAVFDKLSLEEQQSTGRVGEEDVDDHESFGLSAKWFKVTSKGKTFKNTWVFMNVCHSAGATTNEYSFAKTFIDLGAAAFSGYSDYVSVRFGNAVSEKAIAAFTAGYSYEQVIQFIKKDEGLKAFQTHIASTTKTPAKFIDLNLFTSKKGVSDNFYLKNTNNTINIDTAVLSPNTGSEGTPVKFTVKIKSVFVHKIDRIVFAIDGKRKDKYIMHKTDRNTWRYTKLIAPKPSISKKSVFEYKCYDKNNTFISSGFAVFHFN